MRPVVKCFWAAAAVLLFFPAVICWAYVPGVGEGVCVGGCEDATPTATGGGYVDAQTIYAPSGPSAQELARQREDQDLGEAALDASDDGVKAYQKGDFAGAVNHFAEALEYAPDDPDIQHNLSRAREALRQSETGRALKTADHHSTAAAGFRNEASSAEARRGFDTAGESAGSLSVPAIHGREGYKEPEVPATKRTPGITKMETKREVLKKSVEHYQSERQKLDPVKDAVKIVEIKQKETQQENEIHFLNFSITEELRKAPEGK